MTTLSSGNFKDVKEQFIEQNGNAMPITTTKILIELATPAACRIITPEGMAGTGALYSVKTKAELISVLTTSKHVLSKAAALSGNTELQFSQIESLQSVILQKEWIAFIWSSVVLYTIIIELKPEAYNNLEKQGAKSLQIVDGPIKINSESQPLESDTTDEILKVAII